MDHLSEQIINEHQQRRLNPEQLLAVDEHLASCDQCHLVWSKSRSAESAAELYRELVSSDLAVDDHISYETLEAFVDDEASDADREITEVHLETCSRCAAELRALEELRDQKPEMVPQLEQTTRSSFSHWGYWPRIAFATVATLLVAAAVWFVWKSRQFTVQSTNTEIAASVTPSPANVSSPIPRPSPSPSPAIVVSLQDAGATVTLDATGKITGLDNLPPGVTAAVKTTLTTERLDISSAIAGLRGKGGTLMGRGNQGTPFRLLSPVGVVVQSDQPTLRWEPCEGASVYVVKLYDSNFKELAKSLSQTDTSWRVPLPLPRGGVYTWQVTAIKEGEEIKSPTAPAPQVKFRVLAREKVDGIRRAQNIKPTSHLALGTLYAEAGLLEEARREFRILLQANPGSKVAQRLLQEVNR